MCLNSVLVEFLIYNQIKYNDFYNIFYVEVDFKYNDIYK